MLRFAQKPPRASETVETMTSYVLVYFEGRLGVHLERDLCRHFALLEASERPRGQQDNDEVHGAAPTVDTWMTRWMGQPPGGLTFYTQTTGVTYVCDRYLFAHVMLAFRAGATRCAVTINAFSTTGQTRIFCISPAYATAFHDFAHRRRAGTSHVNALENYFNANITPTFDWEDPSIIRILRDACREWNDGAYAILDNDAATNPAIAETPTSSSSLSDSDGCASDAHPGSPTQQQQEEEDGRDVCAGACEAAAATATSAAATSIAGECAPKKGGRKRVGRACRTVSSWPCQPVYRDATEAAGGGRGVADSTHPDAARAVRPHEWPMETVY